MADEQAVAFDEAAFNELFSNAARMVEVLHGNLHRLVLTASVREALRADLRELENVAAQQAVGKLQNWTLTDLPGAK